MQIEQHDREGFEDSSLVIWFPGHIGLQHTHWINWHSSSWGNGAAPAYTSWEPDLLLNNKFNRKYPSINIFFLDASSCSTGLFLKDNSLGYKYILCVFFFLKKMKGYGFTYSKAGSAFSLRERFCVPVWVHIYVFDLLLYYSSFTTV